MQIPQLEVFQDDALLLRLKHYSTDVDWIEEHRDKLRARYPDLFVAVKKQRVIFTAPTMDEIVKLIDEAGASAEDCAVEYISLHETDLLL
jgi:hypothetical protein